MGVRTVEANVLFAGATYALLFLPDWKVVHVSEGSGDGGHPFRLAVYFEK